ncbi:YcaO-like family protein [Tissierella pigra]|uniref:YcaO-like family protein n=1 Tax=Tissierella pigra TaxID=2607614 RepID=UPI001C1290A3|nr:YcaO-like family protein [Tissierella pigra]
MKNIERALDTKQAIRFAKEHINRLNLDHSIHTYKSSNKHINTTVVNISNYDWLGGNLIGNGKGFGEQSLASALFETLEHYYYAEDAKNYEFTNLKIQEILDRCPVLNKEFPINYIHNMNIDEDIKCFGYKSFNKASEIFYPAFLINVDLNYTVDEKLNSVLKYVSNSGFAMGICFEEAAIHAINELLERDALSMHYIDSFINEEPRRIVKKSSLNEYLLMLVDVVEKTVGAEVEIVDITSNLKIPSYMVYFKRSDFKIPIKGFGTSLIAEYALERALLECLQAFHLYDIDLEIEDQQILINFEEYPVYKRIALLDYNINCVNVEMKTENNNQYTVKELLNIITEKLDSNNLHVYYRVIYDSNNVCCINVIIPSIEKFYLVGLGMCVIPNDRGMERINGGKNYNYSRT